MITEPKTIVLTVHGLSPLIMHNGDLANQFNPIVKQMAAIKSKRGKTEADTLEIARLSWLGALYVEKKRIVIPQHVWQAAILNGAKKMKLGKNVGAGLIVPHSTELQYPDKGLAFEELYEKENAEGEKIYQFFKPVVIGRSRVMNMRAIFPEWYVSLELLYYPDLFNEDQVKEVVRVTGDLVGIGDWRPDKYGVYGRFEIVDRPIAIDLSVENKAELSVK